MLALTMAVCFTCKGARHFSWEGAKVTVKGDFSIRTGICAVCGDNMVRVTDSWDGRALDARPMATGPVYRQTWGDDGPEDDFSTPAGQRRVITLDELFSRTVSSIDVYGNDESGMAPWKNIVAVKAASGHFDNILRALLSEGMKMPFVAWDPDGENLWRIGNGHHRLVAALLLGMELLPVVVSTTGDYMRDADSMDDENSPIGNASERKVWSVIRKSLPGGIAPNDYAGRNATEMPPLSGATDNRYNPCGYCREGLQCGCCSHDVACPNRTSAQPDATKAVRKMVRNDARAVAVEAVEALAVAARAYRWEREDVARQNHADAAELILQAEAAEAEALAAEKRETEFYAMARAVSVAQATAYRW